VKASDWLQLFIILWFAVGAFLTITMVGKPRKPITGGQAAFVTLVAALLIGAILTWWPG
jgi:hypothetical protein